VKDHYDKIYKRTKHYQGPPEDSPYYPLWKEIVSGISQGEVVLDVGCGSGQFGELCARKGVHYTGIDYSTEGLIIANGRKPKAKYYLVDVEKDQSLIEEGNYAIATFIEFLEHIEKDIEVLSKVPTGKKVFITGPNYEDITHVRFFNSLEEFVARYESLINVKKVRIASGDNSYGEEAKIFIVVGERK